jgi:hypothetical protein
MRRTLWTSHPLDVALLASGWLLAAAVVGLAGVLVWSWAAGG